MSDVDTLFKFQIVNSLIRIGGQQNQFATL